MTAPREATVRRQTAETDVRIALSLDGGPIAVATGLPFFDHLLTALARHGRLGLDVQAEGDLHVDDHHTVEDVGITLGQAVRQALGDRRGIERTGDGLVPMDEALVRVVVDLGGRSFVVWEGEPASVYRPRIDLTVLEGFVRGFADHAGANVHVDVLRGRDYHHVVEAVFKALGRALRAATRPDGTTAIPSTKEVIE